ncbi:hypothetical protein ABVT39_018453 [Epinephelus coioides]
MQVTFMELLSCRTPRHSEGSRRFKKRKREIDIDALRELEEESRREAREECELLFKTLAEHKERVAAAREREQMLRREEAEESRQQMLAFQQGLLAMFGMIFKPQSQPEPPPMD